MKHKILLLVSWFIRMSMFFLPDSYIFSKVRGYFYGLFMPKCGSNFQVSSDVRLLNLENLYVGNDVYLAPGVIINAIKDVHLDDEVMIGFNTVIVSGNHTQVNGSYRFGKSNSKPIKVCKGVWIAANCTIVAGVSIDSGILVAANSSVVNDLVGGKIFGGTPARVLR